MLRDPLGDISMSVTCQRQVIDSADPPVVEGASVVVHGRPRYYTNRGTLSLVADEIRMVGLGELLARLERRRQLLAAEGLFARERKRPLPFLPHRIGLVTSRGSAAERDVLEHARRRWPAVAFETRLRRHAGHQLRARGDRGRAAARRRRQRRRHRHRPRRRVDRGPAAVLRRGAGAGRVAGADPGRLRDRPRARHPDPRPRRRRPRRRPRPTPPSCWSPTSARSCERVAELRRRARRHVTTWWPTSRPSWPTSGPGRSWPPPPRCSSSGRPRSTSSSSAPAVPSATASTAPPTTSTTPAPACGRCPRSRRCAAATPWCRTRRPRAHQHRPDRGRRPRHAPASSPATWR